MAVQLHGIDEEIQYRKKTVLNKQGAILEHFLYSEKCICLNFLRHIELLLNILIGSGVTVILLLILWSSLAADTSMEKQECQEKKAALASWQMRVVMASLDRAHVLLKEVIFCHNNLSLKSLVLKGTCDKIRSSRVVCRAFQEKPRPLSLSSAQSLHY